MKIATFDKALAMRSHRCPICRRKFEDISDQVRKKSLVQVSKLPVKMTFSAVNNSVRLAPASQDGKPLIIQDSFLVVCENKQHVYQMTIKYTLDYVKLQSRDIFLVEEYVNFKPRYKPNRLKVILDYVKNETRVIDTRLKNGILIKPSILPFTDKDELVGKIDRLINFVG